MNTAEREMIASIAPTFPSSTSFLLGFLGFKSVAKPESRAKRNVRVVSNGPTLASKFNDIHMYFSRKGKNKPKNLGPMLRVLGTKYIKYDTVIFMLYDDATVKKLQSEKIGFLRENHCVYARSDFTMYWPEYKIEVEIVSESEWEDLRRCINLSNTTGFYNLNKIYEALYSDNDIE